MEQSPLLEVKNLEIQFNTLSGNVIHAVNSVNLTLNAGESLGIVGESGSGKSQFVMSIMGLLAKNARVFGEVIFEGRDLLKLSTKELNTIRGTDISMIFQDPMTSLNPYLKISTQMIETVENKHIMSTQDLEEKALNILKLIGITAPEKRFHSYPYQLSGGMRQRIMIAMALLSNPKLLIADEPTTALDVTIQAQILDIITNLQKEFNLATILITHDLGIVANLCDKIAIFYGGQIVEFGTSENIFYNPAHPYTKALLNSIPRIDSNKTKPLELIPGNPPILSNPPELCVFRDRCTESFSTCNTHKPVLKVGKNTNLVSCLKEEYYDDR